MKTKFIMLFFFAFQSFMISAQENVNILPDKEIKDIVGMIVDLPELQQYFHVDEDSTRKPLIIKESGFINSKVLQGLEKFNQAIQVLDEKTISSKNRKAYLDLTNWDFICDKISIKAQYPIEGIHITMKLKKVDADWKMADYEIFEE